MGFIKEFKDFALKGNVVGLAIAVIIGAAFGAIVSSLVDDVITPLLLTPALEAANVQDLDKLSWGAVKYGKFLSAIIKFIIIALVLFLIIKGMNSLKKKKEDAAAPAPGVFAPGKVIDGNKRFLKKPTLKPVLACEPRQTFLYLYGPVKVDPTGLLVLNEIPLSNINYQIKLPQFEGPFDLLLFFIERDELDIYNIPITKIINDFLAYIHSQESLNIELSSEFILFISTLMRIKAKMLLPRKEIDAQGNEIDPRQELVDKILEYKKYKEAAAKMAELEAERMLMVKRGNIQKELSTIGEEAGEGTEIQAITLFKLMKAFERAMQKYDERFNKPVHTVVQYNYTMEQTKTDMISLAQSRRTLSFEKIFENVENRVHAIFTFLSMLELVQMKFLRILIGEGKNNFIVEYNETEEGLTDEEHMHLL